MRNNLLFVRDRFTKCDSGETLNRLMHPFLFTTLVLSLGFLFFGDTTAVQSVILYQQTLSIDQGYVNLWGVVGLLTMTLHTLGFLIRGRVGVRMMQACIYGGFYLWAWAGAVYLMDGFLFQFLFFCIPNLYFWSWYAWQWKKRNRGDRVAFV